MTILKEVSVVTGTYTNQAGETKKRYKTIGHIHSGQYGEYLTLDASVNLAAFPRKDGDDRVMCNLYEPKAKGPKPAAKQEQAPIEDDIPFN